MRVKWDFILILALASNHLSVLCILADSFCFREHMITWTKPLPVMVSWNMFLNQMDAAKWMLTSKENQDEPRSNPVPVDLKMIQLEFRL